MRWWPWQWDKEQTENETTDPQALFAKRYHSNTHGENDRVRRKSISEGFVSDSLC